MRTKRVGEWESMLCLDTLNRKESNEIEIKRSNIEQDLLPSDDEIDLIWFLPYLPTGLNNRAYRSIYQQATPKIYSRK